jgi:hypothetical protein
LFALPDDLLLLNHPLARGDESLLKNGRLLLNLLLAKQVFLRIRFSVRAQLRLELDYALAGEGELLVESSHGGRHSCFGTEPRDLGVDLGQSLF